MLVFAALVDFSRMYFFVHYPTDVLFGAALGVVTAVVVCKVPDKTTGKIAHNYAKEIYDQTADRRLRTALP